ncbi:TPA: hypothetical protein ACSUN1_003104 [Salmonella enterica subsp. diarizonae]
MSTEMHESSIKKIKGQIKNATKDDGLNDGLWGLKGDIRPFDTISIELNKRSKGFQIDRYSCKRLYLDAAANYKKQHGIDSNSPLSNLPDFDVDSFVDCLFGYYSATPLPYEIIIPLQWMKPLPEHSSGEIINVSTGQRQLMSLRGDAYEPYSEVKIATNGFWSVFNEKTFIKTTLQTMNVVVFALKQNGILRSASYTNHFISTVDFLTGKRDGILDIKANAICKDYEFFNFSSSLPISIGKYLNELALTQNFDELEFIKKSVMTDSTIMIANELLANKSDEAARVKSAIDWLIQSEINEDETMAFIQICMGLESIFGDNDSEGGLTNTLADRCAYLIGRNIAERKEIKDEFKKMYKVRSKIIHGVKSYLTQNEDHIKDRAFHYLNQSILREMRNLREIPNRKL